MVSARLLSEELGRPALNLGTLSYLDPAAFAILLREHTATNPGRLRAVVLLMHPEALRRAGAEPYQMAVLQDFLNGRDHFRTGNIAGQISFAFGVDIFKGRVLARLLPVPLGGSYGRHYGFNKNLEDFMTDNFGSAVDPAVVPLAGRAEYYLSPGLEAASRQFRIRSRERDVRLWISSWGRPSAWRSRWNSIAIASASFCLTTEVVTRQNRHG